MDVRCPPSEEQKKAESKSGVHGRVVGREDSVRGSRGWYGLGFGFGFGVVVGGVDGVVDGVVVMIVVVEASGTGVAGSLVDVEVEVEAGAELVCCDCVCVCIRVCVSADDDDDDDDNSSDGLFHHNQLMLNPSVCPSVFQCRIKQRSTKSSKSDDVSSKLK